VENLVIALAAAACPVGMGLMMWFMTKGARPKHHRQNSAPELEQLREEHRRLGAELDRLEDGSTRSSARKRPNDDDHDHRFGGGRGRLPGTHALVHAQGQAHGLRLSRGTPGVGRQLGSHGAL
jgi:hypothetical protein